MFRNKRLKLSRMAPSRQSTSSAIARFYDPDIQAEDAFGRTQEQILAWSNSQLEHSHNYIQVLFPLPEGSPFNWSAPVIDLETVKAFRTHSELRQQLRRSFERMLTFYGFTTSIVPELASSSKQGTGHTPSEFTTKDAAISTESAKEGAQEAQAPPTADDQATAPRTSKEAATVASSTGEAAPSTPAAEVSSSDYIIIPGDNWPKASRNWCVRFDHNHLRITRILRCLRVLGLQKESEAFFAALKRVYDNPAIGISARSLEFWTRAAERPLHLPPDDMEDECEWLKGWEREATID